MTMIVSRDPSNPGFGLATSSHASFQTDYTVSTYALYRRESENVAGTCRAADRRDGPLALRLHHIQYGAGAVNAARGPNGHTSGGRELRRITIPVTVTGGHNASSYAD